jgi:hypothetical protein
MLRDGEGPATSGTTGRAPCARRGEDDSDHRRGSAGEARSSSGRIGQSRDARASSRPARRHGNTMAADHARMCRVAPQISSGHSSTVAHPRSRGRSPRKFPGAGCPSPSSREELLHLLFEFQPVSAIIGSAISVTSPSRTSRCAASVRAARWRALAGEEERRGT